MFSLAISGLPLLGNSFSRFVGFKMTPEKEFLRKRQSLKEAGEKLWLKNSWGNPKPELPYGQTEIVIRDIFQVNFSDGSVTTEVSL